MPQQTKTITRVAFTILIVIIPLLTVSGQDSDTLRLIGTVNGEYARDQFGIAVGGGGDVNNDGVADFLVGANVNDDGGDAAGKAYLYLGGATFDATPDLTVIGGAADFLGNAVDIIDDVNNDGFDDILIAASFNSDIAARAGKVLLLYGGDPLDNTPDLTAFGEAASDYFGHSVTGAGDLNGDGFNDWAVGSYKADDGSLDNIGKVYVFFGGNPPDDIADLTIVGNADGERFGFAVAGAGRFNGDSYDDLVVGAYSYDSGSNLNLGRAYVYFGGNPMDGTPDLIMTGENAFDFFGTSVAGGKDLNGDTYDDIIVGATGVDYSGHLDAGKCYVFLGGGSPDNVVDFSYAPQRANSDLFGSAVDLVTDLDGNSYDDFIIGARDDNEATTGAGKAYLFNGSSAVPFDLDTTFLGTESGAVFAADVAGTGSLISGYRSSFVVGSWGTNDSTGSAAVYGMTGTAANQPPVLATIGSQSVVEGTNLNFTVSASDPEGVTPQLFAEQRPANASFIDHGDGTGTFDFNPDETQAGTYEVRFMASDGDLADTEMVPIIVIDSDCDCGDQAGTNVNAVGDVNCSGTTDPTDVGFLVAFVYKSWSVVCDKPLCPFASGDVNCDLSVSPVDVQFLVNFVYRGWDMLCDGCVP